MSCKAEWALWEASLGKDSKIHLKHSKQNSLITTTNLCCKTRQNNCWSVSQISRKKPQTFPPGTLFLMKSFAKQSASAARPSICMDMWNAKNDAISSYKSHQARLHNMMEELQRVWFTVFDSHRTPATLRVSFRSCWGRLECILKAIFFDVLQGRMSVLRGESWERLKKTLEALKAELAYHHRRSVLQNQTKQLQECFTDLTQKASDISTWDTILEELLSDRSSNSKYRNKQVDVIEENLDRANQSLQRLAALAQRVTVPTENLWNCSVVTPTSDPDELALQCRRGMCSQQCC